MQTIPCIDTCVLAAGQSLTLRVRSGKGYLNGITIQNKSNNIKINITSWQIGCKQLWMFTRCDVMYSQNLPQFPHFKTSCIFNMFIMGKQVSEWLFKDNHPSTVSLATQQIEQNDFPERKSAGMHSYVMLCPVLLFSIYMFVSCHLCHSKKTMNDFKYNLCLECY